MKVAIQKKNGLEICNINRRTAIRQKCLNCSGYSSADVTSCTLTDCSLYAYRSGNGKQAPPARAKAIKRYCLVCCANQHSEVLKYPVRDCPLFFYRKSQIDRSIQIQSLLDNDGIEGVFEMKIVLEGKGI